MAVSFAQNRQVEPRVEKVNNIASSGALDGGLKCEKIHFNIIRGKTPKMYEKPLKLYHLFLKSGEIR